MLLDRAIIWEFVHRHEPGWAKTTQHLRPYAAFVLKRWKEGCRNGSQLYREMKEKGYSGSEQTVHSFLRLLREQLQLVHAVETPATPVQAFSAKEAVWLFVRDPASLDETEQENLAVICQVSDTANGLNALLMLTRKCVGAPRRSGI